jgi:hypothetical protein
MRRRAICLLPAILLAGCSVFQGGVSSLPTYVRLGSAVLETELNADLTTLTDRELAERHLVMLAVTPAMEELTSLAQRYDAAIVAEAASRPPTP